MIRLKPKNCTEIRHTHCSQAQMEKLSPLEAALKFANEAGYPVIVKQLLGAAEKMYASGLF